VQQSDSEVPEADAIEQSQDVDADDEDFEPTIAADVPEADALEQAAEVDLDDDGRRET
jgi:hypothetical protein